MTLFVRKALVLALFAAAAAPTLAASTAAPPLPTADCIAQYFGPLQPLVTAVCKLGG